MNILANRADIEWKFAKSLVDIAEILLMQEDVVDANPHLVVADLLHNN